MEVLFFFFTPRISSTKSPPASTIFGLRNVLSEDGRNRKGQSKNGIFCSKNNKDYGSRFIE